MAENKQPVGILFDIGGVCVSAQLTGPENISERLTQIYAGCFSIPSDFRL